MAFITDRGGESLSLIEVYHKPQVLFGEEYGQFFFFFLAQSPQLMLLYLPSQL